MQKILIVKIGAVGDVVMALSLLTHFRDASITWVVGKAALPLLQATGKVAKIIAVDEKKLFQGVYWQKCLELVRIQLLLAGKKFDLLLTGHLDYRYRLLSLFTRAKKVVRGEFIAGRYHSSEYVRLVSEQEQESSLPKLTFPPSEHADPQAIVLAPGGAKNALRDDPLRRWPILHYAALAKKLAERGIPLILTGAATDLWILPYFTNIACKNLVGKCDLLELTRLLQDVKLLITHDSGPMHLAKLVGCQTIALFGPTNPFEKVGKNEKIKVLWGGEHLSCRPCYNGKSYAACNQNECLATISPERVFQEAIK